MDGTLTASAIDQFTDFLTVISSNQDSADRARQLKILKRYCDEQFSASHDQTNFPDLLSAWSRASQSNEESTLSAIPSALTQFLRTISTQVEFRDFGLSLCHSLLKRDTLRLFDRGLSSPKSKDHLISPCLQLLTEITSFDGGALASNVFSRRDLLYRRLDGVLSQAPVESQEPTAHRAALEFLLANLKYLDSASKSELITHSKTVYAAVRSLSNEQPDVVTKVLHALRKSVLNDENLSKQMKVRCFNSGVLSALAKLYDYQSESFHAEDGDRRVGVRDALQQLLLQTCTTTNGVLHGQTGWYPVGTDLQVWEQDESMIDLGLDSPYHFDDYTEKVPVKNATLSAFIQSLKPESDVLQASLITAVFKAAPELVADYFTKKPKLLVPPGDDPVWRGQFAFLFSVVQLPVPQNCGWPENAPLMPPPLSIVIESILPRPTDRATIGKCLRMNEDIMIISSARLLTVAFNKLDSVLRIFNSMPSDSPLWKQASRNLIDLFTDRVPPLQDIITALQSHENADEQVRTAILECIATYHTILPSITAGSKFDIGPTLSKGLQTLESDGLDPPIRDPLNDQVQHLIQIANISPATKWFHKSSTEDVSLVVQLLKCCAKQSDDPIVKQAIPILKPILSSKGILSHRSHTRSLDALVSSLTTTKKWQPDPGTYRFLDNCMTRTMQRPVKYLDQLEHAQHLVSDSKELSLLACCVGEQWPFVLKKEGEDKKGIKSITEWVARLFSALQAAGENYRVMTHIQEEMLRQCEGNEMAKAALKKALEKQRKKPAKLLNLEMEIEMQGTELNAHKTNSPSHNTHQELKPPLELSTIFLPPPPIPTSLAPLTRWTKPDFESEIQSGRLASLIRCLISSDPEIRLSALHTLQTVMHAVEQSSYSEKTQLYLLLGELLETVRTHSLALPTPAKIESQPPPPPPAIIAEMAVHFLPTLADPSSPFYRKTNSYLLAAPRWSTPHILPHWINETFLSEPESDDSEIPPSVGGGGHVNAQALEIEHFLDLLLTSLRREEDMDLFRRAGVFGRVFDYFLTPACTGRIARKILQLVYAATRVQGASDTLITRAGVREWLDVARRARAMGRDHIQSGNGGGYAGAGTGTGGNGEGEMVALVDALRMEVERTCDHEAIKRWESERPVFKLVSREE